MIRRTALAFLATRAPLYALAIFVFCGAVSAQTLRSPQDPRNQAPTTGTGGPAGGPTGLFTVYDGDTIRKGEFTFSVAYSNYDRDPETVDIADTPLSFNIGLNDHIELFYKSNGYRRVKEVPMPSTFTLAPSYLPDAQFITGLSGKSRFTDRELTAKIALVSSNNTQEWLIVPFYRSYPDNAIDFRRFRPLPRDAIARANAGNFGVIGFLPGRLTRYLGVSTNPGYIFTRNPKSEAMTAAVLLDRPDEFLSGVSSDFLINKHFWLFAELNSTGYTGGKTQNGLNNNPVDAVSGIRILPARWWGIGAAYRRQMNQQDVDLFNGFPSSIRINLRPADFVSHNALIIPGTTRPATASEEFLSRYVSDDPNVLVDDPNVLVFQLWAAATRSVPATHRYLAYGVSISLPCQDGTSSPSCSSTVALNQVGRETEREHDELAALIYGENHERSSSPVPLTSSQNSYEPWTWNRPYYGVNNPVSTVRMFVWGRHVSKQAKARFRWVLNLGPEHVKKICAIYGTASLRCRQFREANEAFGPEGVKNGVTIAMGKPRTKGAAAETNVAPCSRWKTKTRDNPTGQQTTVTFPEESVNSDHLIHYVRHEGSHVTDGKKWRASGCKLSRNPFIRETEFKAYIVASLSAEAYKPDVAFGFQVPAGGAPGKEPFVQQFLPIYLRDLKLEDLETLRETNIDKYLALPKAAGGLYGVTDKSPGFKAFGSEGRH